MDEQNQPAAVNDAATTQIPDGTEDRGGVIVQDTVVGEGTLAESGKYVALHYTGMLEDGTVFDSSIPRKKTFEFRLGAGDVIPGWDKGIEGMKIGGKRRLIISPEAGYGDQEIRHPQTKAVIIPANATLIFDVELLGVRI
jgi:peptidylprolyl isomerase